ncbi:T9SS type A sorting domain-containing protein [candidate division WOR-3 bacterium]|nr:T9SS type A sorting domain-containing protein [candidate division WOR-3 bacterium]
MKKYMFAILFIASTCFAGWGPDVRLTDAPGGSFTSLNNAKCVAASGDTVYVVWWDQRDGTDDIYFKRSIYGGSTWEKDTNLTNTVLPEKFPSLAASRDKIHASWIGNPDGYDNLYYSCALGGINWLSPYRPPPYDWHCAGYPSISVLEDTVHILYLGRNTGCSYRGISKIYGSHTGGWDQEWISWHSIPLEKESYPSIVASGSKLHGVWCNDGTIYYSNCTSYWDPETTLTQGNHPCVAAFNNLVYVIWQDNRDGNPEIYYKQSLNNGETWELDERLTNATGDSKYPSLVTSSDTLHLVWQDNRDGNWEIYYKQSPDGGTTWTPDTALTDTGSSEHPSITVSDSIIHIVWQDNRDGNYEIYYKRYLKEVGVEEKYLHQIPQVFLLSQNQPNPFHQFTVINYQLPGKLKTNNQQLTTVSLKIYDIAGKLVRTLVNEPQRVGYYEIKLDSNDLSAGIYFYKLEAGKFTSTKKFILLK